MIAIVTESETQAQAQAQQDYVNSHTSNIITDDMISIDAKSNVYNPPKDLPQCWDWDRFGHHLR